MSTKQGANDWFVLIEETYEDHIWAGPFKTKAQAQVWHIERVGTKHIDGSKPYKIIRMPELAGPARELHARSVEQAKERGVRPETLDSVVMLRSKTSSETGQDGPEVSTPELREVSEAIKSALRSPEGNLRTERPEGAKLTRDHPYNGPVSLREQYVKPKPDDDDKWGTVVLVIVILMAIAGALLGLGHGLSQ